MQVSTQEGARERPELPYDPEEITAQMFARADAKKVKAGGAGGVSMAEVDYGMHLYLGFMAILAVNPQLDLNDLERIKGSDLVVVMHIGRNFMLLKSAVVSQESSSGGRSETMPESSTPPSPTSSVYGGSASWEIYGRPFVGSGRPSRTPGRQRKNGRQFRGRLKFGSVMGGGDPAG